jgi:hypothetical protein
MQPIRRGKKPLCQQQQSRAPRDFFFNQKRIDTKDFNFKVDFEFRLKGPRAPL